MEIVAKYGANYLVCEPSEYHPKNETLFFGETEITPGIKIKKIGERKRTSFEASEESYFKYEGTMYVNGIKHCIFSSTWKDKADEPIYRFAFAMPETAKPSFLFLSKQNGSGADIDCRKVTLYDDYLKMKHQ